MEGKVLVSNYIELGPVPYGENCEQVGTEGYDPQKAIRECRAYANQLKRIWPDGDFRVKAFHHDFGTYHEVCAFYSNEHEENIAFEAEDSGPEHWDDEARTELGI